MGLTPEQVKAERKRLGIGTSLPAKLAFNKGMGDERTAEIHNQYAKQIFAEAYGGDPELAKLAEIHIAELPKAARKGQERGYIAECQQKLEAFRSAARDRGLALNQVQMDANAQERYEDAEINADNRAANSDKLTVATGKRVIKDVTANTNEAAEDIKAYVKKETEGIKTYVKNETERGIRANAQNTSAMLGVDAEDYTVKNEDGERLLANNNTVAYEDSAVGKVTAHTTEVGEKIENTVVNVGDEIKAHTTKEHQATRKQSQQQAVLDAKRQTISDMLTNELSEFGSGYRDSVVKWLGSSADRVMAGTDLTYEEKKEALDELVRMVDEENCISDEDRAAFEAKYFYKTQERPHL